MKKQRTAIMIKVARMRIWRGVPCNDSVKLTDWVISMRDGADARVSPNKVYVDPRTFL